MGKVDLRDGHDAGAGSGDPAYICMTDRSIVERVEILEQSVELLERLPDRVADVESQLVQLRHEMRDGFSDIRSDMSTMGGGLRAEMQALRADMLAIGSRIDAGDEETRRYMRVLHEDVISRIAAIGEGA
ncbi:MAG: hypothetical protein ABL986_14040 [Vicinamibacterales bacterium]